MTGAAPTRMEYDPFSPAFQADPFPVYRWMRDEAPVFYSEKWNWWALSRFDDVRAAALDPDTYLSFEGIDIDDTAKDQNPPGFLPNVDNPRHDEIRRVVQPQLLPGRVNEREGVVRATVRRLIDAWRHRGTVDLAQELAWPMPNEVFFDLLGLPESGPDRARLERWVHELKDRKPDDARLTPVAKAATAGIQSYFVDLLGERRREPRADLVTHLVTAEIGGVPFADEHIDDGSEIMGLMLVLFLGGVESTAGLTGTLFKLLAENPDQREVLRANPALIPDAVEEAIRIATPLQLVGRTTSREVTLHGVTIPAGGRVVLVYGAANRDERRFGDGVPNRQYSLCGDPADRSHTRSLMEAEPELVLDTRAELGECPVWAAEEGALYWVDIRGAALHRFDPGTGTDRVWPLPTPCGSFALRPGGGAVVALADGFHALDLDTGAVERLVPVALPEGVRFNDGKVSPDGRFFVGTMDEAHMREPVGVLYRLDPDLSLHQVADGLIVSNGLAWSADGATMYHADTHVPAVWAYAYDAATGAVSDRRVCPRPAARRRCHGRFHLVPTFPSTDPRIIWVAQHCPAPPQVTPPFHGYFCTPPDAARP